jgi:hypothetical protein
MNAAAANANRSWFNSAAGLRFGIEIGAIVLAKFALLILLYLAFVTPQPRTDTSPTAMRAHVLPAASAAAENRPADAP